MNKNSNEAIDLNQKHDLFIKESNSEVTKSSELEWSPFVYISEND